MLQTAQIEAKSINVKQLSLSSNNFTDKDIIARIKAGDDNAYGDIIRRYNQRMFRIARSIVTDDAAAMDIVQEAHIKAYTKLNEFRGSIQFFSWLAAITRNEALMYLRRNKREISMTDDIIQLFENTEIDFKIDTQQDKNKDLPDTTLENAQLQKLIVKHIDQLPENFRIVFVLRAVEQLSVKETAEILNIKEKTVKTRYYRAKRILRSQIQIYLNNAGLHIYEFGEHHCDVVFANVMDFINHSK
ncbi:MAG: RNA polymerase sigma factor [Methylococcaceae bacterium]